MLMPTVILMMTVGFVPIVYSFVLSFFDGYENLNFVGLRNYLDLFEDKGFMFSFRITFAWAVLHATLTILLSLSLTFTMMKHEKLCRALYTFILIPWGIPMYISVPIWRAIIHGEGGESILHLIGFKVNLLTDPIRSFIATVLIGTWLSLPMTVLIFLSSVRNIRVSILEAMKMDGANDWVIFRYLVLPLMKDNILLMFIIDFIKSLREFNVIFMTTSGGPPILSGFTEREIVGSTTTLGIFVYRMFDSFEDSGKISACSILTVVVVMLVVVMWLSLKRAENRAIPFVVAIFHLLFGGKFGPFFTALYLSSIRRKKLYPVVLIIDLIFTLFLMMKYGFLRGFNTATMMALMGYVMLRSSRSDEVKLRIPRISPKIHVLIPPISSFMLIVSTTIPIWALLWLSFSKVNALFFNSIIPKYPTFENYVFMFKIEKIQNYILNTLLVSSIVALFIPFICFPTAYLFSRYKTRGRDRMMVLMSLNGMIGGVHTLIPLFFLFNTFHMVNTYIPLILVYLTHSITFSVYTMKSFLDTVPTSFDDMARIEGIGRFNYILRILLPISLPVITVSMMVAFLNAWNGFTVPLIFLNDDSKYTMGVKIFSFVGNLGSASPKWGIFASTSVLNLCITSSIFYLFKRSVYASYLSEYED